MRRVSQNVDWVLVALYGLLVFIGWINIYSSTYNDDYPSIFSMSQEYGKQFLWICISITLALAISMIEGNLIRNATPIFYLVTIIMLIVVLMMPPIKGARSWFQVGGFGIQPSEFAKITTALMVARYLSLPNVKIQDVRIKFNVVFLIFIPVLFILLQPDAGTVLVFTSFMFVLYREGVSGNLLLIVVLAILFAVITLFMRLNMITIPFLSIELPGYWGIIIAIVTLYVFVLLLVQKAVAKRERKRYLGIVSLITVLCAGWIIVVASGFEYLPSRQQNRIDDFLGIKENRKTFGYNVYQSKSAIGSGSFSGKGYMKSTLANADQGHVPEQSTDFIFCTWAEEWGFLGSSFLITLFVFLLYRIIIIAERQRSKFSRIYGYSVACIIFYHFAINMGMTIGFFPVVGIPLPFLSYGGSSLMSFTVLLFILVRLDSERMDVLR